ncbi:MAG: PDZ domain-containing protein, partial [Planctomycetes bacterium]|nr:PDZ domain-containing protein [Planctomycetota bacterium]
MELRKVMLVAGLGLAALLPAQVESKTESKSARTVAEWISALGSDSYKDRVAAEQALRELGKAALPELQKAAENAEDEEVQWRSRRLARQIESGATGDAVERRDPKAAQEPRGGQSGPTARDQFEDVFRRMERDFGIDIPRSRFFGDDFFRDLDGQFRDLEQRMRGLQGAKPGMKNGVSQGMSMQIGPNGVRVEVQEQNDKGETETKVYEAPDMKTFQEQYGDLLKEHGMGFDAASPWTFQLDPGSIRSPFQFPDPNGLRWAPLDQRGLDPRSAVEDASQPVPDSERLGIFIRDEIPAGVREYLELEAGTGLWVESVQDGSLAASLQLRAGDIVTRIGDAAVGSPADVRRALSRTEAGAEVKVGFVRKGVQMSAVAKKPAAAKPAPKTDEPAPKSQPRIERRRGGAI